MLVDSARVITLASGDLRKAPNVVTPETFRTHLRDLEGLIDGKDPRRLKSPARGKTLLLLQDDDGRTHHVTIHLDKKSVSVRAEGCVPQDDEPFAMIRASVDEWLRFYNDASAATFAPLRLYGDVELLGAVGELLTLNRGVWDVQFSGNGGVS